MSDKPEVSSSINIAEDDHKQTAKDTNNQMSLDSITGKKNQKAVGHKYYTLSIIDSASLGLFHA